PLDGTVHAKVPGQHSGSEAAATARIAGDRARNQANNAIANPGRRSTSTGAAVSTYPETMVPLSAFAHFGTGKTPLSVNHRNLFVAARTPLNPAPNVSLSEATAAIEKKVGQLGMPASIRGGFEGSTKAFRDSLANQPYLIAGALLAVYIVLGVLYESYIHPI